MKKIIFLVTLLIFLVSCDSKGYQKEQFIGEWKHVKEGMLDDKYKARFGGVKVYNSDNTYTSVMELEITTKNTDKKSLYTVKTSGTWSLDGNELTRKTIESRTFDENKKADSKMKEYVRMLKPDDNTKETTSKVIYVDKNKIIIDLGGGDELILNSVNKDNK